jgi:hypothetical protein
VKAFRHWQEPSSSNNETAPILIVSFNQVRSEAEALSQIKGRGFLGDERIRTALKQKTVAFLGLDNSAQAAAAFEQSEIERRAIKFEEPVCGG